jgi:hypothetical protein
MLHSLDLHREVKGDTGKCSEMSNTVTNRDHCFISNIITPMNQ